MGEASFGFCLCVLAAKALRFFLKVGASLYMERRWDYPIFCVALHADVVDGLTRFDDEMRRHMRI